MFLQGFPKFRDFNRGIDPEERILLLKLFRRHFATGKTLPGYEASKANDNDLMTRWGAAGDPREGVLTIDLGEERDISRIWIAETDFAPRER